MNSRNIGNGQQTINAGPLSAYGKKWDFLPLHRPGDTSTDKQGRVRSDGKRPRDFNWTTRGYVSAKVLALCLREGRNVGVRLKADQLVIDVDPRNGGIEGFKQLCVDIGLDPYAFPCVITGSGGFHYYMIKPDDVQIVDTLKAYKGVEFKSKGRQVVAAGSVHPDTGKQYAWDELSLSLADVPKAPSALMELIRRPERTGEAICGGQASQEDIARALDRLDVLKFQDHGEWLRLMMGCHHASNGDARQEFVEWSVSDPQYADDAEVIGRRWDSLHAEHTNGITVRTLNHILREHGAADAQIPEGNAADDFPDDLEEPEEDSGSLDLAHNEDGLSYQLAAEIQPEKIEWLWVNRFAVGKLSIIAGFPDQGKSQITMNIAAIVSKGGEWPNGEGRATQGAVLILSAEDDKADTIVPRLMAAGADLNQCLVVDAIVRTQEATRVLNLADDLGRLGAAIERQRAEGRNVRLVVIDPISAYMGGRAKGDSFKNSEVRALLTPLVEWAARHRIAVIAISHFNKAGNGRAIYRVTDSLAFTAAARTVYLTAEEDGTDRKMMLKGKSNIAADPGGLAYKIEGVEVREGIPAPRIVWDGRVDVTAEEALGQGERQSSAVDRAESFLFDLMTEGPKVASEVQEQATAAGFSAASVRRAKSALGIISTKEGFKDGKWRWRLPPDDFEDDEDAHRV